MRFISIGGVVTRLGRVTSVIAVLLIVMLGLGSVSPETHERVCLHHAEDGNAGHCVIEAFAAGEGFSLPARAFSAPVLTWVTMMRQPRLGMELPRVDHRLQPSCGPPSTSVRT